MTTLAIFAAESRFCCDGCHKFDCLTRWRGNYWRFCLALRVGHSIDFITILAANAAASLGNFAGVRLRHSPVRLSYGSFVDRIFISPTLHQTHHGSATQHWGKNLGGIFAIWDWLAG